jgi:hypothetical protein
MGNLSADNSAGWRFFVFVKRQDRSLYEYRILLVSTSKKGREHRHL